MALSESERRERSRLKKQRARDRLYARGLNSYGRPITKATHSQRAVHPPACPCYDCAWGKVEAYHPVVARMAVML